MPNMIYVHVYVQCTFVYMYVYCIIHEKFFDNLYNFSLVMPPNNTLYMSFYLCKLVYYIKIKFPVVRSREEIV